MNNVKHFTGKISGSLTHSLFDGASPEVMTFGGGAVATMMGGIAAEATGGEFSEGALTAMVVFLYNDIADYVARAGRRDGLQQTAKLRALLNTKDSTPTTLDALIRYITGRGGIADLGNMTKEELRNAAIVRRQIMALKNGTAKALNDNLGVNLTTKTFHVGHTTVVFNTTCTDSTCTTGFVGFVQAANGGGTATSADSFSEPVDISGVEFGTTYLYAPYSWSITYPNKF